MISETGRVGPVDLSRILFLVGMEDLCFMYVFLGVHVCAWVYRLVDT